METTKKLEAENANIEMEKKQLLKQIESEQGNVSQYHEKQARMTSEKNDLEIELANANDTLKRLEQARVNATNEKKSLEQENAVIKKDMADMDLVIQKLEQEKCGKDHSIARGRRAAPRRR